MAEEGRVFEESGSLGAGTAIGGTEVVILDAVVFVEGYRQALQRFRESWGEANEPRAWFFPLFEALNWSVALADNLKSVGKPLDDPVVLGLRFVRNAVHHQWAQALEPRPKSGTQVTLPSGDKWPPVGWDWFWKPVSRLATDDKHRNGEVEYTAHLADLPAHRALDRLEELVTGRSV